MFFCEVLEQFSGGRATFRAWDVVRSGAAYYERPTHVQKLRPSESSARLSKTTVAAWLVG
jgi:hypothetical protein